MKKHSGLILSFVIFGLIGMVALAWAAESVGIPDALTDFQQSHSVIITYQNDGVTAPQGYGLASKHTSGDRIFGTTESSNIYYKTDVKGVALVVGSTPAAGLTDDNMTGTPGGWTAL